MKYLDMHCDTMGIGFMIDPERDFYDNDKSHITLKNLISGDCLVQFFAHFDLKPKTNYDFDKMLEFIAYTKSVLAKYPNEIKEITSMKEIDESKVNALLTVEDGGSVNGKMENLEALYEQGIRAIALTWNFENCFGFPNSKDAEIMNAGLTPFGIEAITRMNELGIAIDVSHLSDGGFYDVAKYSKKPFIASHSNARAVTDHTRNLTDDMIKTLAEHGGVTGINFCPEFLNPAVRCNIEDIITNIKYIVKVGGIDVVGFGTDFDGIGGELEIKNASNMGMIWDALKKAGFSEADAEKIYSGNVKRVMLDIIG